MKKILKNIFNLSKENQVASFIVKNEVRDSLVKGHAIIKGI